MLDEVLEVSVGGAHRAFEPRRDKDADAGDAAGVDVEEAEDLGLGVAEGVEDGAFGKVHAFGQIHHHLHAHCPLVPLVAFGHANHFVEPAADRADGAIADNGKFGADLSAIGGEDHAGHFTVFDERFGDWCGGPDLSEASHHHLLADPLVELAEGEDEAVLLVEEVRQKGTAKPWCSTRRRPERASITLSANCMSAGRRVAPWGSRR